MSRNGRTRKTTVDPPGRYSCTTDQVSRPGFAATVDTVTRSLAP